MCRKFSSISLQKKDFKTNVYHYFTFNYFCFNGISKETQKMSCTLTQECKHLHVLEHNNCFIKTRLSHF